MFTYKTAEQLILGLKSLHPIFRSIQENHFDKITLFCDINRKVNGRKYVNQIIKFCYKNKITLDLVETDSTHVFHNIETKTGLFMSCGHVYIHDIAKQSNVNKLPMYCIDTSFGKISSYGDNIYWKNEIAKFDPVTPIIIFNSCMKENIVNLKDAVYFLHCLYLTLNAYSNNIDNDFINTLAINGVVNTLKNMTTSQSHDLNNRQIKHRNLELARADALMKYAYNNVVITQNVKSIAQACHNSNEFMVVLALKSKKLFNSVVKQYKATIEADCEFNHASLKEVTNDFNTLYGWFNENAKSLLAANKELITKVENY